MSGFIWDFTYKKDSVFCLIVPLVVNVEGGYVNDPDDPGGPTKYGVAWNFNAEWLSHRGITRATMKDLTQDQAKQCYYERYWLPSDADGLTDEGLAFIHFDNAVNCGVGEAKQTLKELSINPKHFDGRGDNNEALFLRLVMEYEGRRAHHYTKEIGKKLKQKYLEGWWNRMQFVMQHAAKLV